MDSAIAEEIERLCDTLHALMCEHVHELERLRDAARFEDADRSRSNWREAVGRA